MRHIHAGVTSLVLNGTTYHLWDADLGQGDLISNETQSSLDNVIFYHDRWGHPWSQHSLSECTDGLSNFGQWPASHETGGGFWPAHQYKIAAQNHAESVIVES